MVSRNNVKLLERKNIEKKQRFSLRKFSVGVASVLIGTTFVLTGQEASADTNNSASAEKSPVEENTSEQPLAAQSQVTLQTSQASQSQSSSAGQANLAANDQAVNESLVAQSAAVAESAVETSSSQGTTQSAAALVQESLGSDAVVQSDQAQTFSRTIHYKEQGTEKTLSPDVTQSVTVVPYYKIGRVTIEYYDTVTNKMLQEDEQKSGYVGQKMNYDPTDTINNLENKGYRCISNNLPGFVFASSNLVWRPKGVKAEAPNVTFKLGTQTFRINFNHGQAPVTPDNPNSGMSFAMLLAENVEEPTDGTGNPTTFYAIVQGDKIIASDLADVQSSLEAVVSPTISNYSLVDPSQSTIAKLPITLSSKPHTEVTVYYTEAKSKATITYIDDTLNITLTTDSYNGYVGDSISLQTSPKITSYENDGYELVSNDFEDGHENLVKGGSKFTVHLKHKTEPAKESQTKNLTVHYIYADDQKRTGKAADDRSATGLTFTRTGTTDLVTKNTAWDSWEPSLQAFKPITSPVIQGYTPSSRSVSDITVNNDSPSLTERTITYTADGQKLTVTFIDDTTDKTLKTVNKTGASDSDSGYSTKDDISTYEGQHYVLVSDGTNGEGLVFDHDDSKDQTYEVHLKHGTSNTSRTSTVHETINYVYKNGQSAATSYTATPLTFTQTGVEDLVTSTTTWNPVNSQIFSAVTSPKVAGYTANITEVPAQTVNYGDKDIEQTVTYSPDAQKIIVNYIDDVTGETLASKTLTGVSDGDAKYNTKATITGYENQHYTLVSDDTNGADLTFDHDDGVNQIYDVHLTHATENVSDSRTKNLTVHYVYADGLSRIGKAADDQQAPELTFTRTGIKDLVTNDTKWNDWNHDSQIFDEIMSPEIAGYSPDQVTISKVSVDPDSRELTEKTVIYNADQQKLVVNFIDDVTSENLKTVNKSGDSDSDTKYSTKDDINSFESKNYKLVSDDTNGVDLVFDHDDKTDQVYNVHLTHKTHTINSTVVKTEVIHYVYADGLARTGKAVDDYNAHDLTFTRDGYHDEVTDEDHWNAWTPITQTFVKVTSPTIAGYTPDTNVVEAADVNADSNNIERTVTYKANQQTLDVTYIDDDNNNKTLKVVTKKGDSDSDSGYNTKADIADFEKQHYKLISDNTDGKNLVFDHDDQTDQHYEVHLAHATHLINDQATTKETIHYQLADGTKVFDDHTAQVDFARDGYNDEVTGEDHWNAWKPTTQSFDEVVSPTKQGYTPDKSQIDAIKVKPGDKDNEQIVTYSPDAQTITVNYIDDVTGKTVTSKTLTGVSDGDAKYNTKATITDYENQHYTLVSDDTNGADLVFDHDDGVNQIYDVHLTHATENVSDSRTKNLTVHYVYADGLSKTGKAADDQQAPELTFTRTGVKDLVTNDTKWNDWNHDSQIFDEITSPEVAGYTPDQTTISKVSVDPDSRELTEKTVIYNADQQKLVVNFIDDVTGKTVKTVNKTGDSDSDSGYNTKADITDLEKQHYKLISDNTDGKDLVFDHDDQTDQHYEVHLTHATHQINDQTTTKETIHYQLADGTKVFDDHTAQVDFARDGYNDEVTGEDHWNAWKPTTQSFDEVVSPAKQGYTPDKSQIAAITVQPGAKDIEQTVTYSPDKQTITINYIDDVTGKTLSSKILTGVSDAKSGYTTKDKIDGYKQSHYSLVSDDTNGNELVFDHDDDTDQVYNVHLNHQHQTVSDSSTINEVIHYVYSDGRKANDDAVAKPASFTRTGSKDLVTNEIVWDAWTPASYDFVAISSPKIKGFTPDVSVVDQVTVGPSSKNIEQTVTYYGDVQLAHVKYIDDTEKGRVMSSDDLSGHTGETDSYTTAKSIHQYEGQGYVLVSDSYPAGGVTFDDNDQVFEVHFKHGTSETSRQDTVNETIHYVFENGQQAHADYIAKPIIFTQSGVKDDVTGDINWTKSSSQEFAKVTSPVIDGYTPEIAEVDVVTVNFGDNDIVKTITYKADTQKIIVNYIDDVTKKALHTDTLSGVSDTKSGYTTKDTIDGYKQSHYVLVSDDTKGNELVFDHDDHDDQVYSVHLTHATSPISDKTATKEVIHYQLADGTKAFDDHNAQVNFARDGYNDEVTGEDHWNAWTPADRQNFGKVSSPAKQGYTPDKSQIAAITVKPGDKDIEQIVTYSPNTQKIAVNYIDDVTGKTLASKALTGVSDDNADYNTKATIKDYETQHYVLVSDDTNGADLVFDHDDDVDQVYNVHLTHSTQKASDSSKVNEVVHYIYENGQQAASDYHAKEINFIRTGVKDLVTGETVWNAWTPDEQSFAVVVSPVISGYTPDIENIASIAVKPGDKNIERTVTYKADGQKIIVNYVDDDVNKTLKSDALTGKSDQVSDYTTKGAIDNYLDQHYVLVSDETNGNKLVFDHDSTKDQTYSVHLKHAHQNVNGVSQVHEVIHYVYNDGRKASDDVIAKPAEFKRIGDKDLVTGKVAWDVWTPSEYKFDAVTSPVIEGYTPNAELVNAITVKAGDKDTEQTVVYVPNRQAMIINYVDDVTGKILHTDTLNGVSDAKSGYTTKNKIADYEQQHYVLVSDETNGSELVFDNNDQSDQVYNVHLTHGTSDTSRQDVINEIINYVYADDQVRTGKAADSYVAKPITFVQTGIKDDVTGEIKWNKIADQTFDKVTSPEIVGYTPDIKVVDSQVVNFGGKDIVKVVTYKADNQKLDVVFIDDVTGKDLKTVEKTGISDSDSGYNTKNDINDFINQHYILVSDQTNGENLAFDHNDGADQHYEVHLTHGAHKINSTVTKSEIIHYVYADNQARQGKAADDYKATDLKFTRDGNHDEVTDEDHWNAWAPVSQSFTKVQSPMIQGYTADQAVILAIDVNANSNSIERTVIYTADPQKLNVRFIDDTTGKTLKTIAKTGLSDTDTGYSTKTDINNYLVQHYELVSDETKGKELVFDHDDDADQLYEVHLKHGVANVSRQSTVSETINYRYANGKRAAESYNAQPITFTQIGLKDNVTGTIKWNDVASQAFGAVKSPVITGYTADVVEVPAQTVSYGDKKIVKTVTYAPDQQTLTVTFIDDTTGQKLKTVTKVGASDTDSDYNTKSDIKSYQSQHYALVSDNTEGQNLVFDHDDKITQHYEVYLKHTVVPVTPDQPGNGLTESDLTRVITETVHYTGAGEQTPTTKYAQLHFNGTAYYDAVTKKWTDANGNELKDQAKNITWHASDGQRFMAVMTPVINGYSANVQAGYDDGHGNVKEITGIDQTSADIDITVTYYQLVQPTTPQPTMPQPTTPQPTMPRLQTAPTISQSETVPAQSVVKPVINNTAQGTSNSATLPQTGNSEASAALGLLGLAISTGLSAGAIKKRRK